MKHLVLCLAAVTYLLSPAQGELAFPGAAGFGAFTRGGKGGATVWVTRLDDDPRKPKPGMLRWAVAQKGPREVKFRVSGTVLLKGAIKVREPYLTIDGREAPRPGICLRGGSLEFHDTREIILRYLRIRLGDEARLKRNVIEKVRRPKGSAGLDCIELRRCQNVIIDHVSASWSCDELFSIVHCRNVTVQWCLLAEPLSNPQIHPYGDNHAYCLNTSASTLSVHHCLFARYVMRGPQFEANDMRKQDNYAVQMEAVNNVMFDYEHSGSRYTAGVEDHKAEAARKGYQFQFLGNVYIGESRRPMIEAVLKHGVHAGVLVYSDHPQWIDMRSAAGNDSTSETAKRQIQREPLFTTTATSLRSEPKAVLKTVLDGAGCSHARDAADWRILKDVAAKNFRPVLRTQSEVGGWPALAK